LNGITEGIDAGAMRYNTSEREEAAASWKTLSAPAIRGSRPEQPITGPALLDRPLLPLAVALPRMLARIETELATAGPAETRCLRQRAELIRGLLTPIRTPPPP